MILNFNWKKIQNGSDIRGVAIDGVENEEVNLTPQVVEQLGKSFIEWLKAKGYANISVAIGIDSRISGLELKKSFSKGATSQGANVVDCGLASTPAMFMTTISENIKANAGVMLTASHLPFNRNGIKFFTNKGGLDKNDISDILDIAASKQFELHKSVGSIKSVDFISLYSNILVDFIRINVNNKCNFEKPLNGLKIIVDAGNGSGGFFAHKVLVPLGADIEGSQFLNPDGKFPNHIPNPEDKVAMASICEAVIKQKADLGIIFDTDVDRSAIVDKKGNPINRNALIALISSIVLEEHPESYIVTDSITSKGLTTFINEKLKGKHHRFKRGYKNVINESVRLNAEGKSSWLAIETSGHAALKENYFLDDGAFLVAKLLVKMARLKEQNKELTDIIQDLQIPEESKEFRLSITINDFANYGQSVIGKLHRIIESIEGWIVEPNNYEGIRVMCLNENEKGWFLLRLSLHDPVMPLNIESDIKGGVRNIVLTLKDLLIEFKQLDLTSMR